MPTFQATSLSCCRRHLGAIALLLSLFPVWSIAAAPGELKRTDTLDMRRAGKVSEDERAVLRIEWRAGLSGVEADRSVLEIMTKLRQMEASVVSVRQMIRNMPSEKRAAPAEISAQAGQVAPEDQLFAGIDWRLMAANLTALVLVVVWWSSRRQTQKAAAALEAEIAAKARAEPAIRPEAEAAVVPAQDPPTRGLSFIASSAAEVAEASSAVTTNGTSPAAPPPPPTYTAPNAAEPPLEIPTGPAAPADPTSDETPVADSPPRVDFFLEEADPATAAPQPPARKAATAVNPASASITLNKNVEPTLQLAEIMLSMGLEQGAAQALVEYTEANPRHAIYHMLKLLGIYRKRGLHKEFQETAEKLRKNFNIQAEDWGASASGEPPTLEKFSRVSQHVESIWNQPEECIAYLRRLLEDNRDGARAGFPQSVAEEILLLVEILKETSGATQTGA